MAGIHTDGTITAFEPQPTCFTPSNLWLTTMPCGEEWSPSDTSAFRADTTHAPNPPMCTVTMLGPPDLEDGACYVPRDSSYDEEGFNECPVGRTSALELTSDRGDGIKEIGTYCCPSAFEFATNFGKVPPTGEDWYSTFFCRATAVAQLSDQTVTLTVSSSPLVTTEAAWDYERDFIYAYPEAVLRYVYEAAGTTSECYGYGRCPIGNNPLTAATAATPAPTTASPATATASETASSTSEAGQDGQGEATQSAQGESGASSNARDILLGKRQGMVASLMALWLILP